MFILAHDFRSWPVVKHYVMGGGSCEGRCSLHGMKEDAHCMAARWQGRH